MKEGKNQYGSRDTFSKVETFHKTFDPRRPEIPTAFTENEAHTRAAFKIEELVEFVAATSPNKEQLHEAVMLHEALDKAEEKYLVKHSGEVIRWLNK